MWNSNDRCFHRYVPDMRRSFPLVIVNTEYTYTLVKVNLSLCFKLSTAPWWRIERVEVQLHARLTSALEVNGQLHAPAVLPSGWPNHWFLAILRVKQRTNKTEGCDTSVKRFWDLSGDRRNSHGENSHPLLVPTRAATFPLNGSLKWNHYTGTKGAVTSQQKDGEVSQTDWILWTSSVGTETTGSFCRP
jgi:hypothetical protein